MSRPSQAGPLPPNRRLATPSGRGIEPPDMHVEEAPPSAPRSKPRTKSSALGNKKRPKRSRLLSSAWFQRFQLMTGVIVVISASVLVAWGLRRYLRSSPRFAVRTIHVDGNQRRSAEQVAKRAGLQLGMNVFTVDDERSRAGLEADPWIADAKVTTDLPATVVIVVVEREARALASVDNALYLVDTDGDMFKRFAEGDPHDLPVFTGVLPAQLAHDRDAVTMRLRRGLELVAELERSKLSKRYPIQEVNVAADGALTVTVGSEGVALAFGSPPYRGKIQKAKRIMGELRYRKVKPAVLFLDNVAHPERVVVRMR